MIGSYGTVVVICVASLAIGHGIFALTGETRWNWLAPAVGYAALLVLCDSVIRLPGHGWTAVLTVIVVVGGAVAVVIGRRPAVGASLLDGLVVVIATVAATAIPFVASGRVGVLGVSFLNDLAVHLPLADSLLHPQVAAFTNHGPPGYPSGPHAIMATAAQGLGVSLGDSSTGLLVATTVLTGLTALAGLEELPRLARWVTATLAATFYLSAAWYAQGAFKEPIVGMLLLALVLLVLRGRRERFANSWRVAVPAALLLVGIVYVYSYTGLVWPAAFLVIWGAGELTLLLMRPGRRRLLHELRLRAAALSAGVGLFVLGMTPEAPHVKAFARSLGGATLGTVPAIAKTNTGNLPQPLSGREALGIWLQSDFRFWPSNLHEARVFSLFALAVVLFGVGRELANRELAIPAALLACALVFLYSRHTQSFYVAAKALVVPAPVVALAAGRGLFRRVGLRSRSRELTLALVAVAVPFLLLAFGSSFVALRGAYVDPADHARELRSFVRKLGGSPTLVLVHDDFYQYELLPVPTTSPPMPSPRLAAPFSAQKPWQYGSPIDFDSVDAAVLDRFDRVITVRTAYQSEPPPNFRLETRARFYDVWRRVGATPPRRVLPEAGAPGAVL